MKPLDYILIAAVAIIVGLAIFFTIKNARKGGCGCGRCDGNCAGCNPKKKPRKPDEDDESGDLQD